MQYDSIATKLSIATYIANGNGRSINDIAKHFDISIRTAYRFLDRLQEEGYPLTNEEMRDGREKLWTMLHPDMDEYGTALPSSDFSDEEKVIVYYVLSEMKKREEIVPSFKAVRTKISNMLSQKAISFPSIDYPESLNKKVYPIESINIIAKSSSKETKKHVRTILASIKHKAKCNLSYHVPNKDGTLDVVISPIFAFIFDGGMYLQALLDDGSLRTYAIERIESIEEIRGSEAIAPSFNPRVLLTDPFGPFIGKEKIEAEVWIAPEQVPYVKERNWPDGINIKENNDGSAIFSVTTYGEHEFTDWLLSQKASAVLLKPDWLRKKMKTTIDDMAAHYS